MTGFTPQDIENLRDYFQQWGWEYEKLQLDNLEEFNLTEESLVLLSILVKDAKAQQYDPEEESEPSQELKCWFIDLVNRCQTWQEIEDALRQKLIDDCRIAD